MFLKFIRVQKQSLDAGLIFLIRITGKPIFTFNKWGKPVILNEFKNSVEYFVCSDSSTILSLDWTVKLSPGKRTEAKSLILSQSSYLGVIMTPSLSISALIYISVFIYIFFFVKFLHIWKKTLILKKKISMQKFYLISQICT